MRYSQRFSTSRAKDTINVGHLSNYKNVQITTDLVQCTVRSKLTVILIEMIFNELEQIFQVKRILEFVYDIHTVLFL